MKTKQKLILLGLFVMFLAMVGMFYYQNFHKDTNEMEGKKLVVIATQDIAKGDTFKYQENYKVTILEDNLVLDTHIVFNGKPDEKVLEGKLANSPILKNELVTTGRVSSEESEDLYRLFVQPDNQFQAKAGDLVNVYVQLSVKDKEEKELIHYRTYKLLDGVSVKSEVKKKNSNGQELQVTQWLEVHVSENEAIDYNLAKYLEKNESQIIVLQHENALNENESVVPAFSELREEDEGAFDENQILKNQLSESVQTKERLDKINEVMSVEISSED